jgi:hypothetical protein
VSESFRIVAIILLLALGAWGLVNLRGLSPPTEPIPDCPFVSLDDTGKGWKCWTKEDHDKFWAERGGTVLGALWHDIKEAF